MRKSTDITIILTILLVCILGSVFTSVASAQEGPPVVNVNEADVTQLAYLPGIGPVKAQAIVDARAKEKFLKTSDLIRVIGIGPKTLEKISPHVTLDGATTATAKIKAVPATVAPVKEAEK